MSSIRITLTTEDGELLDSLTVERSEFLEARTNSVEALWLLQQLYPGQDREQKS